MIEQGTDKGRDSKRSAGWFPVGCNPIPASNCLITLLRHAGQLRWSTALVIPSHFRLHAGHACQLVSLGNCWYKCSKLVSHFAWNRARHPSA